MKKALSLCVVLGLCLGLASCGSQPPTTSTAIENTTTQMPTVEDILESAALPEVVPQPTVETPKEPTVIPEGYGSYESVDIDLTTMNSVMVYTQVYAMVTNPDEYVGKVVKMHGTFGYYYEESVDVYYFGLIVEDATACCSQGMEFELAGEHAFPDDYPEPGEAATVVGVFETYFPIETPDWEYYHLADAEFIQ